MRAKFPPANSCQFPPLLCYPARALLPEHPMPIWDARSRPGCRPGAAGGSAHPCTVPAARRTSPGGRRMGRQRTAAAFASPWVFSSLKCCGKRLPRLPPCLLFLSWKRELFVRENGKEFWQEGLSVGCRGCAGTGRGCGHCPRRSRSFGRGFWAGWV